MDPELLKLIKQAVEEGIFATGWTVMVVGLISAGLGAFVGAYLKRKGEYLATKSLNLTGKIMRFYVKDSAGSKVRWPAG